MRAHRSLLAITAGALLLGAASGARAGDWRADHDRNARNRHREIVRAERQHDSGHEEAREAELRRERPRAEEARREREAHERAERAHRRHDHDPFGYVRATDREHDR